jgi:tyrosinase
LFERELQTALRDPDFGLPYWNIMNDAEGNNLDPLANPMWTAAELGSNGRLSDGVVTDEPFAFWPIVYSRMNETTLCRQLGEAKAFPATAGDEFAAYRQTTYDDSNMLNALSIVGYRNWAAGWQSVDGVDRTDSAAALHSQAHVFVGGSMSVGSSPNDPVFFLLHSFVDGL